MYKLFSYEYEWLIAENNFIAKVVIKQYWAGKRV